MYVLSVCPKRKPKSCSVSPLTILQLEFRFFLYGIEKFVLYTLKVHLHPYCDCGKSLYASTGFSGECQVVRKKKFLKIVTNPNPNESKKYDFLGIYHIEISVWCCMAKISVLWSLTIRRRQIHSHWIIIGIGARIGAQQHGK